MNVFNLKKINALLRYYVSNPPKYLGIKASSVSIEGLNEKEIQTYTAILWAAEKIAAAEIPNERDWIVLRVNDSSPVTTES